MLYGYTRVSTCSQDNENQRFSIQKYAKANNLKVNVWVEEIISSRKPLEKRKLYELLNQLVDGDKVIITEISRLGRNLYELGRILDIAINKKVEIISLKENYVFTDNIQSRIISFTFGLAYDIERSSISSRTKQSLEKIKASGRKLGRPFGCKNRKLKLAKNTQKIKDLLAKGYKKAAVARMMEVDKTTMYRFLKQLKD